MIWPELGFRKTRSQRFRHINLLTVVKNNPKLSETIMELAFLLLVLNFRDKVKGELLRPGGRWWMRDCVRVTLVFVKEGPHSCLLKQVLYWHHCQLRERVSPVAPAFYMTFLSVVLSKLLTWVLNYDTSLTVFFSWHFGDPFLARTLQSWILKATADFGITGSLFQVQFCAFSIFLFGAISDLWQGNINYLQRVSIPLKKNWKFSHVTFSLIHYLC